MTKTILAGLKVVPILEAVNIPFFNQFMKDGTFQGNDSHKKAVTVMLDELARWTKALASLRGV